jgi:branched-chain amino acid transport system substrate-binding protein
MAAAATAPQKFSPREDDVTKPSAMMAAAIAAAAALISMPSAQAAGTVKIGILWPLTGNAAAAGQASKAAAEVAAEIVNNKHPELGNLPLAATEGLPNQGGAKLELTFVDHQGNPSLAQQLATRLITQDAVHGLMGAYQSY